MRTRAVLRFSLQILMSLLQGCLLAWAGCATIVWIVRDGLGPGSQESGWVLGLWKTTVIWGVPALVLAVPLYGLMLLDRRLVAGKRTAPQASR